MPRFFDVLAGIFLVRRKPAAPRKPSPPASPRPPVVQPDWHLKLLVLHTAARAERGLTPLVEDHRLRRAAQAYADWMAAHGVLPADHRGPGTKSMLSRVCAEGYAPRWAAENTGRGRATADAVFDDWLGSGPHRESVLNVHLFHVGFGRAKAGDGVVYWCAVYAAPSFSGVVNAGCAGPAEDCPPGIDAA